MTKSERQMVAQEILTAVRSIQAAERMAQDDDEETAEVDPKWLDMIRSIRKNMMALGPKKNHKLSKYNIDMLRKTDKVIDLLTAVSKVIGGVA